MWATEANKKAKNQILNTKNHKRSSGSLARLVEVVLLRALLLQECGGDSDIGKLTSASSLL